jgi:anti-sigma regulatory factor (Ser/Thr protein kinase)
MNSWVIGVIGENADVLGNFDLGVAEALQNAGKQGGKVALSVEKNTKKVTVSIRDYTGKPGYVPKAEQWVMPPPTDEFGNINEHGRGFPIMKETSDKVEIIAKEDGTLVRLTKKLK